MLSKISLGPRVRDLSGRRFSALTAIEPVERRANGHVLYRCKCDCGAERFVTCSNLMSSHTMSCGCVQRDVTGRANSSHGRSKTALYRVWRQMKERCHRPGAPNFKWYGARGVSVCERWRESFEAFVADMGPRPDGFWIERIDNDGPYSPSNCEWAPPKTQAKNTRRNRFVTYQGRTQIVADWERELGLGSDVVGKRLRSGKTTEEALSTEKRK